jgi:hypothetical protein
MLQKRRNGQLRRTLTLESLETRMCPSGVVTAVQDIFTGAVFITGDSNNNCFQINKATSVLGDMIQVAGCPGTHTAVNGLTSGPGASFVLASVSNLFIVDGNGSNTILLGLQRTVGGAIIPGNGFVIPGGNITFDVGSGTDDVELLNIQATVGMIDFTGNHGTGHGTDTVNYTNVIAGASVIIPGRGKLTVNQSNVILGFDIISASAAARTGAQDSNDNIRIINSMLHPPPRLFAIGQLTITDADANNTFFLDTIDVGPAAITSGIGNNVLTFSHSLDLQADIVLGTEAAGAEGNNIITMDTDKIVGQHVLISVFDESGVSGSGPVVDTTNNVANGPNGGHRNPEHISHTTLNNLLFTTAFPVFAPQLGVRMDDGDYYYDTQNGKPINTFGGSAFSGSSFVATTVDLPGIMSVTMGDHMQNIQLGQLGPISALGVPAATDVADVDAGQLFLQAENDLDTVTVAADVTGQFLPVIGLPVPIILPATEFLNLGDNTLNPANGTLFGAAGDGGHLMLPYVFTSGTVGTLAIDGSYTLLIGNNLNGGDALGWPVKQTETVLGHLAPTFLSGNLLDAPTGLAKLETGQNGVTSPAGTDNGLSIFLDPTIVQGDLRIFMGSGGFFHRESLVMNGVTAGNIFVQLNSFIDPRTGIGDVPDGNPNLGAYIALDHVLVTDTIFGDVFDGSPPGLVLTDIGTGADFVSLGLIPGSTAGFGFAGGMGAVAGDFLTVNDEMFITLAANGLGGNTVEAHNTTCAFGIVDGNAAGGGTYTDDGGNFGYFVINLVG